MSALTLKLPSKLITKRVLTSNFVVKTNWYHVLGMVVRVHHDRARDVFAVVGLMEESVVGVLLKPHTGVAPVVQYYNFYVLATEFEQIFTKCDIKTDFRCQNFNVVSKKECVYVCAENYVRM